MGAEQKQDLSQPEARLAGKEPVPSSSVSSPVPSMRTYVPGNPGGTARTIDGSIGSTALDGAGRGENSGGVSSNALPNSSIPRVSTNDNPIQNENGLSSLSAHEIENLSSGKKNKVLTTFNDAVQFIKNALRNKQIVDRAYLGKVPNFVALPCGASSIPSGRTTLTDKKSGAGWPRFFFYYVLRIRPFRPEYT